MTAPPSQSAGAEPAPGTSTPGPDAQLAAPRVGVMPATDYTKDLGGHDDAKAALHPAIADQTAMKQHEADEWMLEFWEQTRSEIIPTILRMTDDARSVLDRAKAQEGRLKPAILQEEIRRGETAVAEAVGSAGVAVEALITQQDQRGRRDTERKPVLPKDAGSEMTVLLALFGAMPSTAQGTRRVLDPVVAQLLDDPGNTRVRSQALHLLNVIEACHEDETEEYRSGRSETQPPASILTSIQWGHFALADEQTYRERASRKMAGKLWQQSRIVLDAIIEHGGWFGSSAQRVEGSQGGSAPIKGVLIPDLIEPVGGD